MDTISINDRDLYALAFPVRVARGPQQLGRYALGAVPIAVQLWRQTVVSGDNSAVLLSVGPVNDVRDVVEYTRMPKRDVRVPARDVRPARRTHSSINHDSHACRMQAYRAIGVPLARHALPLLGRRALIVAIQLAGLTQSYQRLAPAPLVGAKAPATTKRRERLTVAIAKRELVSAATACLACPIRCGWRSRVCWSGGVQRGAEGRVRTIAEKGM